MGLIRRLAALAIVGLAGCTAVPLDAPRTRSAALPVADYAGAAGLDGVTATRSAFVPLTEGNDALGARLRMIAAAERSVDMKTFLIKPDLAGSLFALELTRAAERGVRVRLLIDDVFTTARDKGIAALDAHPNIEVRVFNPVSRNSPTWVSFLFDFQRVNRRMHNKAMIVDGRTAIVGGRNIADEYYQIGTESDFADFDIFTAGPAVQELERGFDLYWNDPWSVPIAALNRATDLDDFTAAAQAFDRTAASPEAQIYRRALGSTYLADLRAGRIAPSYGTATVVTDPPGKLRQRQGGDQQHTAKNLFWALSQAEREVLVLTPYFVPEAYGARFLEDLAARGIRIRVVTNALAATNHAYVHAGYSRYRPQLLAAGVELFEVRPDPPELADIPGARLTMHTKLAVIDDDTLWVGSMNYDPRSVKLNSEIGMLIHAPDLARRLKRGIDDALPAATWAPAIGPDGALAWTGDRDGQRVVTDREPGAGWWRRFVAGLTGILPVEGQL